MSKRNRHPSSPAPTDPPDKSKRHVGLPSEPSGRMERSDIGVLSAMGASSDHRQSWRAWPPGPPVADPRAKRRGGQPGNKNAFKHGFYTGLFRAHERQLLENLPAADLSAEIELIRVTSARFIESLMASKGTLDYESNLTALRLVNLSAQSISTLLRVQALTGAAGREMAEAIHEFEQLGERIEKQTAPAAPLPSDTDPHFGLVPSS